MDLGLSLLILFTVFEESKFANLSNSLNLVRFSFSRASSVEHCEDNFLAVFESRIAVEEFSDSLRKNLGLWPIFIPPFDNSGDNFLTVFEWATTDFSISLSNDFGPPPLRISRFLRDSEDNFLKIFGSIAYADSSRKSFEFFSFNNFVPVFESIAQFIADFSDSSRKNRGRSSPRLVFLSEFEDTVSEITASTTIPTLFLPSFDLPFETFLVPSLTTRHSLRNYNQYDTSFRKSLLSRASASLTLSSAPLQTARSIRVNPRDVSQDKERGKRGKDEAWFCVILFLAAG